MMDELMFEEMDTDVDREYEILESMDRYDMTYEEAEAFYEADHIDDEEYEEVHEMRREKKKIYNNTNVEEMNDLHIVSTTQEEDDSIIINGYTLVDGELVYKEFMIENNNFFVRTE